MIISTLYASSFILFSDTDCFLYVMFYIYDCSIKKFLFYNCDFCYQEITLFNKNNWKLICFNRCILVGWRCDICHLRDCVFSLMFFDIYYWKYWHMYHKHFAESCMHFQKLITSFTFFTYVHSWQFLHSENCFLFILYKWWRIYQL